MKKLIAFLLMAAMVLSLAACGKKPTDETPNTDETPAVETEYKLGMGVVVNTESSKTGNAQVDATVAAVVTDADGKIVACRIDVAQNKMAVEGGVVDTAKTFQTKMELGSAYGMEGKVDNNGDGVMLEWDAQTKAFEEFVIGKTAAEVRALELQEANGHQIAVDETLLKAGCTIQITDHMEAVAKACEDAKGTSFKTAGEFKLGVSAATTAESSTAAAADKDGSVQMYTDFGAAVIGADGKILAALTDAIQPKIAINTAGDIVEAAFAGTKRELGSAYGMEGKVDNNGDGVMLEWDAQSKAFSDYAVGKTAADLKAMETQEVNGHFITVDEDLLKAGCTIQFTGMSGTIAAAAEYAR